MNWTSYKALCDRPDVWSRWMLEQTRELLDGPARLCLAAALARSPLPKPADHKGGPATDMLVLQLTGQRRREVLEAVRCAVSAGRTTSAPRDRGLGGFVESWQEYANFDDENK